MDSSQLAETLIEAASGIAIENIRWAPLRSQLAELSQVDGKHAALLDEFAAILSDQEARLAALIKLLIANGTITAEAYARELLAERDQRKS